MTVTMQALIATRRRLGEGRWFLLALLMALASALVPAVCASGMPASTSVGSAFDPTTNAVALRGRSQALVRAQQANMDPADKDAAPNEAVIPVAPIPEVREAISSPSLVSIRANVLRLDPRRVTDAQPRAPPIAIG